MTPTEAAALRKNTTNIYSTFKIALHSAAEVAKAHPDTPAADIAERIWQSLQLDDLFHQLGSQGYRQLIRDGWNPFQGDDES